MTDHELRAVVDRCARFIEYCGDARGVLSEHLAERIDAYRDLDYGERFRVQVLLCQHPSLACTTEMTDPILQITRFRFFPRRIAPAGAYSAPRPGP